MSDIINRIKELVGDVYIYELFDKPMGVIDDESEREFLCVGFVEGPEGRLYISQETANEHLEEIIQNAARERKEFLRELFTTTSMFKEGKLDREGEPIEHIKRDFVEDFFPGFQRVNKALVKKLGIEVFTAKGKTRDRLNNWVEKTYTYFRPSDRALDYLATRYPSVVQNGFLQLRANTLFRRKES